MTCFLFPEPGEFETELGLSPVAKRYLDRLILRYAIWFGLGFLSLNIATGLATIWTIWGSVYAYAKADIAAQLNTLKAEANAKRDSLFNDLRSQNSALGDSLKSSIEKKFDFEFVSRKLAEVTSTSGKVEAEAATAISAAADAKARSAQAVKISDDAISQARDIAEKITNTYQELKKAEGNDFARAIALFSELVAKNPEKPWDAIFSEIKGLENKLVNLLESGELSRIAVGNTVISGSGISMKSDAIRTEIAPGEVWLERLSERNPIAASLVVEQADGPIWQGGIRVGLGSRDQSKSKMLGRRSDGTLILDLLK